MSAEIRRRCTIVLLVVISQAAAVSRADAWFGFLDELSGPGMFWGAEFDLRIVCWMDQPAPTDALADIEAALQRLTGTNLFGSSQPLSAAPSASASAQPAIESFVGVGRTGLEAARKNIAAMLQNPQPGLLLSAAQTAATLEAVVTAAAPPGTYPELRQHLRSATTTMRSASIRRVRYLPGAVGLWGLCTDRAWKEPKDAFDGSLVDNYPLSDEQKRVARAAIQTSARYLHTDRVQRFSIGISYREFANSPVTMGRMMTFHRGEPNAKDSRYAGGELIHERIIAVNASWPVTGRFDFLNAQTSIGIARFSSDGIPDAFWTPIWEPVRVDAHIPGWAVDRLTSNRFWRAVARVPLSLSYRLGMAMYPAGFSAADFNDSSEMPVDIPWNEMVIQQGIVVNVGHLIWGR